MTDTENPSGVADDSIAKLDSCPGAVDSSKGFGSASLAEVLDRMKARITLLPVQLRVLQDS